MDPEPVGTEPSWPCSEGSTLQGSRTRPSPTCRQARDSPPRPRPRPAPCGCRCRFDGWGWQRAECAEAEVARPCCPWRLPMLSRQAAEPLQGQPSVTPALALTALSCPLPGDSLTASELDSGKSASLRSPERSEGRELWMRVPIHPLLPTWRTRTFCGAAHLAKPLAAGEAGRADRWGQRQLSCGRSGWQRTRGGGGARLGPGMGRRRGIN